MSKQLSEDYPLVSQIRGFSGFRKRTTFKKKLRILETRSLLAEKEFKKLEMEVDYVKKVEPLKYSFLLVLGVICILLTLNVLV
jgi:hypothetical protein